MREGARVSVFTKWEWGDLKMEGIKKEAALLFITFVRAYARRTFAVGG